MLTSSTSRIKIGSAEVQRIIVGTTIVWETSVTPPTAPEFETFPYESFPILLSDGTFTSSPASLPETEAFPYSDFPILLT